MQLILALNSSKRISLTFHAWLLHTQVMWCDVKFYVTIELLESLALNGEKLDISAFPKLTAIQALVAQDPKIAAWIKERPKTSM